MAYEPWDINQAMKAKTAQLYNGATVQPYDYTNSGYGMVGGNSNDGGLFSDWTGQDKVAGITGVGELGLGLLNYLGNRKVQKSQIRGLDQQVKQSQYDVGAHKNFISGSNEAFR